MNAPSSYRVINAVVELAIIRERLLAIDPTIEDDEALFADMMEGEAPDALRIIERLIEASVESDDLAHAAKRRKEDLADRQARFERRRDAYRAVALQALEGLNLRKLERPAWTASIRAMPPPVILDEAALSAEWWRERREPMRAEIRKALLAGEPVVGAQLGNAATGITVRTR